MKEDLSLIKRYPIVEYLERKGIKPVRRTPAYALYRSPLREETHPSFKVDTEKNLWIDYAEGKGGSIIDLYMRLEDCTLSEAIRHLGRNTPDYTACSPQRECIQETSKLESIRQVASAKGARRLTGISDTLPLHLQKYLTEERCINIEKATPFLRCISYEVRGHHYQAIGFANQSGGYELRDNGSFKGTIAPKDITPIFIDKLRDKDADKIQPVCVFEGFMDFLSLLSMKEGVTSVCLVMNSVSNVARAIRYLNDRHLTHIRAFLDNDDAGRKATNDFIRAGFKVEDMSVHYGRFKDLNEYHIHRVRGQQKRQSLNTLQPQTNSIKTKQVKYKMR
ncbi:toprim domain-containing protein [Prevotella melaninogenica]|uniref:toprim domain-containing protein n=1 Tax=Prevotella melaninogenica TaxID=28132 RepID=UPI001C5F4BD8|nr:toprim domain-containing protein [Prevotella melaninogenica]MBW4730135.1 toprim domain-containing protein [Prevotella melaninogenica]MBW4732075.1 toprim domain-containing protein [Prevotella melaninogenica]MBW4750287.1 toprim domain-containing protein [Prevotella melaninogenica]